MKRLSIYKAQGIGAETIEAVEISFVSEIPSDMQADYGRARFKSEAKLLFDALRGVLPGGTKDQLLCLLLEDKVSLFRVRE